MNKTKNPLVIFAVFAGVLILMIVGLELIARLHYGLGNPVLYEDSKALGYRMKPRQNVVRRDNNRIHINSLGCRAPEPDKNAALVLVLGDSVVYGGSRISDRDLFTTRLEYKLNDARVFGKRRAQVLNCGTSGYAIKNAVKFLDTYGASLSPELVVAVFPTHGFFLTSAAGRGAAFPRTKPSLALSEAVSREFPALWRRIFNRSARPAARKKFLNKNYASLLNDNFANVEHLVDKSQSLGARFLFSLTPMREELELSDPVYNIRLRRDVGAFMSFEEIFYYDPTERFKQNGGADLFLDKSHFTERGHFVYGNGLARYIVKSLGR